MKRRNVLENEKAVSPVIATILMVAITVVLAATLYMMLPDSGDTDTAEAMSGRIDTRTDGWLVNIDGGSISYEPETIQLFNADTGQSMRDDDATLDTDKDEAVHVYGPLEDDEGEEWYVEITFNDNDGNGDINSGDSFRIKIYDADPSTGNVGTRGDMPDGYQFRLGGTNLEKNLE